MLYQEKNQQFVQNVIVEYQATTMCEESKAYLHISQGNITHARKSNCQIKYVKNPKMPIRRTY